MEYRTEALYSLDVAMIPTLYPFAVCVLEARDSYWQIVEKFTVWNVAQIYHQPKAQLRLSLLLLTISRATILTASTRTLKVRYS